MVDIAFDVALSLQHYATAADRPHYVSTHNNFVRQDAPSDAGAFADDDVGSVDVALNVAVDLDLTFGTQVAVDRQVRADDGWREAIAT